MDVAQLYEFMFRAIEKIQLNPLTVKVLRRERRKRLAGARVPIATGGRPLQTSLEACSF